MNALSFHCHPQMINPYPDYILASCGIHVHVYFNLAFTTGRRMEDVFKCNEWLQTQRVHLEIIIFSFPAFQLYLCEGEERFRLSTAKSTNN